MIMGDYENKNQSKKLKRLIFKIVIFISKFIRLKLNFVEIL